ncbi:MAG: diguanylate cyclase [Acidobacteriota bacterium]|nr:diguanylate cyclase [Acidobacteriota bacterium]
MRPRPQTRRSASWLCRTADERGRLVDLSRRLRRAEVVAIGGFLVLALAATPSTGWGLIGATVVGAGCFGLTVARLARSRRPEYLSVGIVAVAELVVAGGILLSSGPRMLLVVLLAGPMLIGSAIWPTRGVIVGTLATAALMLVLAFVIDGSAVMRMPVIALVPVAVLVSSVILASAARTADVDSRAAAAADRLTGLLNRSALLARAAELAHQAELTGEPVGLLLGDVDRFKEVNDTHGHEAGDATLVQIATRLREALGSSGSIYRFGGEELVVLVPGADASDCMLLAERLRRAVERKPIRQLSVTMSFGVAASPSGERFDFEDMFAAADAALYAAKGRGRNRICGAAGEGERAGWAPAEVDRAASGNPDLARSRRGGERRGAGRHRGAGAAAGAELAAARSSRPAVHSVRPTTAAGSWLAPDEPARVHMLDLIGRLRKVRMIGYGILFATIASGGPQYGWWPLLPPIGGLVVVSAVALNANRLRRPEVPLAAALMLSYACNASSPVVTSGRPFFALPLLIPPFLAWAPAFPRRAVVTAALLDGALVVGAGMGISGHQALANPLVLGVPLCLLVAVTAIGTELGRSASDHRGAAVIDQLTGMLNRAALESRVAAIGHEAAQSGQPVALIVGDIDHFKLINDRHGHARGDVILREVAYRIRKSLRAFEAAYRIGGEEFVVLVSGVGGPEAAEIAERLRTAVCLEPIDGLAVTMSFGVAASGPGEPFDYRRCFAAADAGLYEAKAGGRDRVVLATDPAPATRTRAGDAPDPPTAPAAIARAGV